MKKYFFIAIGLISLSDLCRGVERICSYCAPQNDGDIVHREDALTPGWIGHAGIKLSTDRGSYIIDVNTGRLKGRAVAAIEYSDFLGGQDFWGAKRSAHVDLTRVNFMTVYAKRMLAASTEYDGNHSNQKGEQFTRSNGEAYFEFDCVGFVEYLHEETQDELTPREFEQGSGWPLTVAEQRDLSFSFEVGR